MRGNDFIIGNKTFGRNRHETSVQAKGLAIHAKPGADSRRPARLPIWQAAQTQFESRFGAQRSRDLRNTLQDVVVVNLELAPA
jgi:hypothetical protein